MLTAVQSFLQGFIPSLVVIIFFALLPALLQWMGRLQGITTFSAVTWSAVSYMCCFQACMPYVAPR